PVPVCQPLLYHLLRQGGRETPAKQGKMKITTPIPGKGQAKGKNGKLFTNRGSISERNMI
ncbi:MAG TPA: hypothetical protein PKW31_08230, partial [Synergistales bacterium]|nr:hypothetical protein [Synergistales bacterium]